MRRSSLILAAVLGVAASNVGMAQEVRQLSGQAPADEVRIFRGEATSPAPAPVSSRQEPVALPSAIAGETLWLLDVGDETVTACQLESTFTVGKDRISCTRRHLDLVER